ncbi:MAG: type IV secretory system conjugative DNA transfer family protein [Blautia sp.]|nr:type IV secretory system conjugative DNA transfer family protein [Blautia sp.]
MTPKELSSRQKMVYGITAGAIFLTAMFYLAHLFYIINLEKAGFIQIRDNLLVAAEWHALTKPFELSPFPASQLGGAALFIAMVGLAVYVNAMKKRRMMQGAEEGSSHWNHSIGRYAKEYSDPPGSPASTISSLENNITSKNMILTDSVFLSMDGRQTMRNNNILVIGGSGAGKSRFFVKPNLLQANASFVITDPSGELLESCGDFLEKCGYQVKIFNLVEMCYSNTYNPFNYIRDDEGVLMMIHCLIENTTPKGASKGDPFGRNRRQLCY